MKTKRKKFRPINSNMPTTARTHTLIATATSGPGCSTSITVGNVVYKGIWKKKSSIKMMHLGLKSAADSAAHFTRASSF